MTPLLAALLLAVTTPVSPAPFESPPLVELTTPILSSAQADTPAVRTSAPDPAPDLTPEPAPPQLDLPQTAPPGLSNCDELHWYRVNAGLPARFDALGWRESNCRNEEGVHTSCCYGWWQLNVALHLKDHRLAARYHNCGVSSRFDVDSDTPGDKLRQACATKALYDVVGFSAWQT